MALRVKPSPNSKQSQCHLFANAIKFLFFSVYLVPPPPEGLSFRQNPQGSVKMSDSSFAGPASGFSRSLCNRQSISCTAASFGSQGGPEMRFSARAHGSPKLTMTSPGRATTIQDSQLDFESLGLSFSILQSAIRRLTIDPGDNFNTGLSNRDTPCSISRGKDPNIVGGQYASCQL